MDGGREEEEERTREGRGCSVFSGCTLLLLFLPPGGCTLPFFHRSVSHCGTGSLTAAATELDGFDLLWLEKTFNAVNTHTHTHT